MTSENKRRTVWFPDSVWARIAKLAKRDGRTISGWLRSRAEIAVARETAPHVTPPSCTDAGGSPGESDK